MSLEPAPGGIKALIRQAQAVKEFDVVDVLRIKALDSLVDLALRLTVDEVRDRTILYATILAVIRGYDSLNLVIWS